MNRSIWSSKSLIIEMPWGYERQWATMLPLDGKVLYIKDGARTSMKMFETKDEVLFVQEGEITATIADEDVFTDKRSNFRNVTLLEGDVLNIQAGCPYRLKASKGDAVVIEISNGQYNDCTRIDDDYGRKTGCGNSSLIRMKLERLSNDCN